MKADYEVPVKITQAGVEYTLVTGKPKCLVPATPKEDKIVWNYAPLGVYTDTHSYDYADSKGNIDYVLVVYNDDGYWTKCWSVKKPNRLTSL